MPCCCACFRETQIRPPALDPGPPARRFQRGTRPRVHCGVRAEFVHFPAAGADVTHSGFMGAVAALCEVGADNFVALDEAQSFQLHSVSASSNQARPGAGLPRGRSRTRLGEDRPNVGPIEEQRNMKSFYSGTYRKSLCERPGALSGVPRIRPCCAVVPVQTLHVCPRLMIPGGIVMVSIWQTRASGLCKLMRPFLNVPDGTFAQQKSFRPHQSPLPTQ